MRDDSQATKLMWHEVKPKIIQLYFKQKKLLLEHPVTTSPQFSNYHLTHYGSYSTVEHFDPPMQNYNEFKVE